MFVYTGRAIDAALPNVGGMDGWRRRLARRAGCRVNKGCNSHSSLKSADDRESWAFLHEFMTTAALAVGYEKTENHARVRFLLISYDSRNPLVRDETVRHMHCLSQLSNSIAL